jgi:hypothetical protein
MNTPRHELDQRQGRTHEAAMSIIEAERNSHVDKTKKLRAMMLSNPKTDSREAGGTILASDEVECPPPCDPGFVMKNGRSPRS